MKLFPSVIWLSPLLCALLCGCGGSAGTQLTAEGGMGGSGISMGRASSFEPLTVNGQEFDTSDSQFLYEEEPADSLGDDSGLKLGMVVRVTSVYSNGVNIASQVEYAKVLKGAISTNNVNPAGIGTLVALGQRISVNLNTIYDDGDESLEIPLHTLPTGAVIELSGFTDGRGSVLATRIDLRSLSHDTETRQEIKGMVANLDAAVSRFQIGALSIDYTGLSQPTGFDNELYVEVKGHLINGILQASSLEIEGKGDLTVAEDGQWVDLEGIVTDVVVADADSTLFVLNGQQVLADASTRYDPGHNADDILINQPMKVEGYMDGATLSAAYIDIKLSAADRNLIVAPLEAIDRQAGLLTLMGQTLSLAPATLYEDEINPRFNLSKVEVGDALELTITTDETSQLTVSKLKKIKDTAQVELEGMVQAINLADETLQVLNINVHYPGLTELGLSLGDHVKLSGIYDAETARVQADWISGTDNLQPILN